MKQKLVYKILFIIVFTVTLIGCSAKGYKDAHYGKSAKEIYDIATKNVKSGHYGSAIKDFEALEAKFPYGEYSDKAQLGLAYTYYKRQDHSSALAETDRFLRLHPNHKNADYAYYLKALVNYDANFSAAYKYMPLDRSKREPTQARQAFDDFKTLLKKFPNSKYVPDSRKRMIHLKNQLAKHELHVAQHYFKTGAYLAAANRANYIIKEFEESKFIPDALATMIKSYRKLGMRELEKDAYKILKMNFPDSKQLKDLS